MIIKDHPYKGTNLYKIVPSASLSRALVVKEGDATKTFNLFFKHNWILRFPSVFC